MTSDTMPSFQGEYPQAASLLAMMNEKPLPKIAPDTLEGIGLEALAGDQAAATAQKVLDEVNSALTSKDADRLANCFLEEQSYWRDQLAFTWHLRTFYTPRGCASNMVETASLRGIDKRFVVDGSPQFIPASPTLQFINCEFTFSMNSPATSCRGSMKLVPAKAHDAISWKIWIFSTWVENLDIHPENTVLLDSPGRELEDWTSLRLRSSSLEAETLRPPLQHD